VLGVLVEAEAAGQQRHVAHVVPVGHVDVVIDRASCDRVAQQGREVARHRRDDEDARLRDRDVLAEPAQGRERRHPGRFLDDRQRAAFDDHVRDVPGRPSVGDLAELEDPACGGDLTPRRPGGGPIGRGR
jgi:hypothetical protein